MNDRARPTRPNWLDGRTVAILSAVIALGALMQTGQSNLGSDMTQMREELVGQISDVRTGLRADLRNEIKNVRAEIKDLRIDVNASRSDLGQRITKLDDRLRGVEISVAAIRATIFGGDSSAATLPTRPADGEN